MERVRAWRPAVPGIAEVFHARFVRHAYPMHTHDVWTLLIVDAGAVRYDLERSAHGARPSVVTLLPPHVPHDGRAATPDGFRKRVLYLEEPTLGPAAIAAAVDAPDIHDPVLRDRIDSLHRVLEAPGDEFEAESRLALVVDRLRQHLLPRDRPPGRASDRLAGTPDLAGSHGLAGSHPVAASRHLAWNLRALLDESTTTGLTLRDASARLGAHPTHLVRAFTATFGLPPHAYLTGRRIDLARRLLLDGAPVAHVATEAGFYDQSHLTRHFRRYLGVSPGRYAQVRDRTR